MYVIVVYDIGVDRVSRVCNFMKRYLPRVQNSVFEGELTESKLDAMKAGLLQRIDVKSDAILLSVS